MKKVKSREKFNTSLGETFIVDNNIPLKIGEDIEIDGKIYKIKRIIFPSVPQKEEIISIIV